MQNTTEHYGVTDNNQRYASAISAERMTAERKDPGVWNDGRFKQKRTASARMVR